MKNNDLRTLTRLALLVAIELVMKAIGLGSVPMGPLYMSFLTLPIAVGAITMGPVAGAVLGGVFGAAGSRVVIEEFLVGEEVSLLAFCDGKTALPLPSAQDHKAVFDGDTGPNTGGMGAYSPAPIVPDAELEKMADIAIRPILAEMARQGHPFTGILYAGLMMTKDGPKVLEYNVRFGDPECEPLLMRLESDLLEIMDACIDGRLDEVKLSIRPESALGVVIAAEG